MSADVVRNKQSVDLFVVLQCFPSTELAPFMLVDGEADRWIVQLVLPQVSQCGTYCATYYHVSSNFCEMKILCSANWKGILRFFISRMVAWLYVLVYILKNIYEDILLRRPIASRNLRK